MKVTATPDDIRNSNRMLDILGKLHEMKMALDGYGAKIRVQKTNNNTSVEFNCAKQAVGRRHDQSALDICQSDLQECMARHINLMADECIKIVLAYMPIPIEVEQHS